MNKPYSKKELKRRMEEDGHVEGTVEVEVKELLELDLHEFLIHLGCLVAGEYCLHDITYEVVGFRPGNVLTFHVHGYCYYFIKEK